MELRRKLPLQDICPDVQRPLNTPLILNHSTITSPSKKKSTHHTKNPPATRQYPCVLRSITLPNSTHKTHPPVRSAKCWYTKCAEPQVDARTTSVTPLAATSLDSVVCKFTWLSTTFCLATSGISRAGFRRLRVCGGHPVRASLV